MANSNYRTCFGIDFGTKRIGIAIGQTITKTARPLATINMKQGEPSEWSHLDALFKEWQPDVCVIGIPLNMDGTEQPLSEHAKEFAQKLEMRYHIPIIQEDERLTTKAARSLLFEKGGYRALQSGQVDQVAAQLILENWFEKLRAP